MPNQGPLCPPEEIRPATRETGQFSPQDSQDKAFKVIQQDVEIESHETLIGSEGRRETLILGQVSRLGLIPGRGGLVGQSQDSQRGLTVAQSTRQSLESSSKVVLKKEIPWVNNLPQE